MFSDSDNEQPAVSGAGVAGLAATVAALMLFYRGSADDFVPILDHANLAFHEAGHLFFGILGSTMGLYGGTLGQLVFPVVVTVHFFRKGALVAAGFGTLWFFQNFLNIARYAADARVQQLPLVGGGEHDWWHILRRWGALSADTSVARFFTVLAWAGLIGTVVFAFVLWRRGREDS